MWCISARYISVFFIKFENHARLVKMKQEEELINTNPWDVLLFGCHLSG
jgi:hypothetical protein